MKTALLSDVVNVELYSDNPFSLGKSESHDGSAGVLFLSAGVLFFDGGDHIAKCHHDSVWLLLFVTGICLVASGISWKAYLSIRVP